MGIVNTVDLNSGTTYQVDDRLRFGVSELVLTSIASSILTFSLSRHPSQQTNHDVVTSAEKRELADLIQRVRDLLTVVSDQRPDLNSGVLTIDEVLQAIEREDQRNGEAIERLKGTINSVRAELMRIKGVSTLGDDLVSEIASLEKATNVAAQPGDGEILSNLFYDEGEFNFSPRPIDTGMHWLRLCRYIVMGVNYEKELLSRIELSSLNSKSTSSFSPFVLDMRDVDPPKWKLRQFVLHNLIGCLYSGYSYLSSVNGSYFLGSSDNQGMDDTEKAFWLDSYNKSKSDLLSDVKRLANSGCLIDVTLLLDDVKLSDALNSLTGLSTSGSRQPHIAYIAHAAAYLNCLSALSACVSGSYRSEAFQDNLIWHGIDEINRYPEQLGSEDSTGTVSKYNSRFRGYNNASGIESIVRSLRTKIDYIRQLAIGSGEPGSRKYVVAEAFLDGPSADLLVGLILRLSDDLIYQGKL